MANAAGLINEGLWRKDKEFQKLPRLAQCTFCQVLSQKDLDTAGVLTLHLELLAKGCDELTVDQLKTDFAVLEQSRFVFVDYDTDEVFIRSYVRLVSVKNRNSWSSVPKNVRLVASEKIRRELAVELRRLRRSDAADLADEIDPVPTPSGPGGNPVETPSESGTPSQPHLDGDSLVPVLVLESLPVVGLVGETLPPRCTKHVGLQEPPNCYGCRRARELAETQAKEDERARAEARRHQRKLDVKAQLDCPDCDEYGWLLGVEPAEHCTRHPIVMPEAV